MALLSGVVVYAASMVTKVEDNLKPEEDAPSITQEIQTLEEYKGDVVNILVCGIDYEEGRNYSDSSSCRPIESQCSQCRCILRV